MISWFLTEIHVFWPRNWRYAKNGAETPDGAILEIFHVVNCFQHSILYGKSHDNRWSEKTDGMSGDPTLDPINWPSDPLFGQQMDRRTNRWIDGQMEFLPILQDFIPCWGRCPATVWDKTTSKKQGKETADLVMPLATCLKSHRVAGQRP